MRKVSCQPMDAVSKASLVYEIGQVRYCAKTDKRFRVQFIRKSTSNPACVVGAVGDNDGNREFYIYYRESFNKGKWAKESPSYAPRQLGSFLTGKSSLDSFAHKSLKRVGNINLDDLI